MRSRSNRSADARAIEEAIYQQVADEIASGVRRDGLWAKAIADTGGVMDAAKARYIQLRAQSIRDDLERSHGGSGEPPASNITHTGATVPPGVKGWSWGAFLLNWVWAIGNKTWWGLFALVPYLGLIVAFFLGLKGRELAWRNKQWSSFEEFDTAQKRWSFWGVTLVGGTFLVGVALAVGIPAYEDYMRHSESAAAQYPDTAPAPTPPEPTRHDEAARKAHFEAIYRAHPDAEQLIASWEFNDWLNKNAVWAETAKSGTADQVIAMFNSYKADTSKSHAAP